MIIMSLTRITTRLHFWRIGGLLLSDALVFGVTNPNDTVSFMLIVGYILLCITLYYLFDAILSLGKLYGVPVRHKKRFLRTAILLAGGVIALQSIGQLSPRDILVLAPLSTLLYLYIAYSRSTRQELASKRAEL
jgi:hypothetical protein